MPVRKKMGRPPMRQQSMPVHSRIPMDDDNIVAPSLYNSDDGEVLVAAPRNARVSEGGRISAAERARLRAKEIGTDHRRHDSYIDKFEIPKEVVPEGWTYEWKTYSVYGQVETANISAKRKLGWEPVQTEDHPDDFIGYHVDGQIINEGQILMMIPSVIAYEMRQANTSRANSQVLDKRKAMGEVISYDGFRIAKGKDDFLDGEPEYGTIPKE